MAKATAKQRYDGKNRLEVAAVTADRIRNLPHRDHTVRRAQERVAAAEVANRPAKARDKAIVDIFGATAS